MNQINMDIINQINGLHNSNNFQQVSSSTTDFKELLLSKIQLAMQLNSQLNGSDESMIPSPFMFSSGFLPGMGQQFSPNTYPMQQAVSAYLNNFQATTHPVTSSKSVPRTDYNDIIRAASEKFNVDEKIIHAIIKTESNYNPSVKSHAGAIGLMQLMPSTAKEVGVTDRYDVTQNIFGGTRYFSNMLKQHNGNLELALASYNAGPGNVKKYGGVPPFKETQNYINKIMNLI